LVKLDLYIKEAFCFAVPPMIKVIHAPSLSDVSLTPLSTDATSSG